ncbi:hypothetical protein GCM10007897_12430 [Sphingobium jiangsuense]|uniref:Uncharacterized protein n=1 Tax=Sphingobium jiangsuense TaxID=870476 RepID=A0A7W6BEU3_9SPHN|nr:hypothetical protein [Sphingobium jiangsuense]MBB3925548.1 hypothetical protein [Sphingobium jiangsuense]GLS99860.1 hypothetical protein GCM10007897_12430 [Sphingobium jiangsuense]
MVTINFDELKKLVTDFREVRLADDQQKMGKFEVAGQAVLYSQIAEAYRIGLILMEHKNAMMFINLMKSHNMVDQATKYGNNNYTNRWLFVTKLLYGSWEEKTISKTIFHVWQHDRSSEKYANVLRHLEELEKKPEEVAGFIPTFEYTNKEGITVRKLQGLEVADREANARDGSKPDTSDQLQLGTSRSEPDVMGIPLPAELDPTIGYGSCFFKVENKQMIIFGATKLEEGEFKKLAIARGKVIKKRDDDLSKAADAVSATTEADRKAVTKLVVQEPKLAALKKKLLADPDYAAYIIDAEKEAKKNSGRVRDAQKKKQDVAFMELVLPDSSEAGPVAKSKPKIALVKRKANEVTA